MDKKGKKKKGTLGVGNANLFFASESDKVCYLLVVYPSIQKFDHTQTPVQKWQSADISSVTLEKSKHVDINFANGDESLHFISKDADAIKKKLETSKAIATGGMVNGGPLFTTWLVPKY